jgi:hypothetical protein
LGAAVETVDELDISREARPFGLHRDCLLAVVPQVGTRRVCF